MVEENLGLELHHWALVSYPTMLQHTEHTAVLVWEVKPKINVECWHDMCCEGAWLSSVVLQVVCDFAKYQYSDPTTQ